MAQGSLLNFSSLVSGIRPVGQKAHNAGVRVGPHLELESSLALALSQCTPQCKIVLTRMYQYVLIRTGTCHSSTRLEVHSHFQA